MTRGERYAVKETTEDVSRTPRCRAADNGILLKGRIENYLSSLALEHEEDSLGESIA